jgi:hypothetical protein
LLTGTECKRHGRPCQTFCHPAPGRVESGPFDGGRKCAPQPSRSGNGFVFRTKPKPSQKRTGSTRRALDPAPTSRPPLMPLVTQESCEPTEAAIQITSDCDLTAMGVRPHTHVAKESFRCDNGPAAWGENVSAIQFCFFAFFVVVSTTTTEGLASSAIWPVLSGTGDGL